MALVLPDDWMIERGVNGSVTITSYPHRTFGKAERISVTIPADFWADAVAHVSADGMEPSVVKRARRLHDGKGDMRNLDVQGNQMRDPDDQMEYLGG